VDQLEQLVHLEGLKKNAGQSLLAGDGWLFFHGAINQDPAHIVGGIVIGIVLLVCFGGFFNVEPNQAAVLSLFGLLLLKSRDEAAV